MKTIEGLLAGCLLLFSVPASALLVTLDPDDYAPGTDLTTISPFVTLTDGAKGHVFASQFSCANQTAPTGGMVFAQTAAPSCSGWASQAGGPFPDPLFGTAFVAAFAVPVESVGILGINFGYSLPFFAEFSFYDENFRRLGGGVLDAPLGQAISISFSAPGIRYFDIGGGDSIGALSLDRLSFSIPEPGSLPLMAIGVIGLLWVTSGRGLGRRKEHRTISAEIPG